MRKHNQGKSSLSPKAIFRGIQIAGLIICHTMTLLFLSILFPATIDAKARDPLKGKVIVRGAPISMTNGILFDSNDRLHIASLVGREVVVMDSKTGKIVDRLGNEVGIESPDDIAFGPDGSLYWTSLLTGTVGRISPDGVKSEQFVGLGANAITFSDDNRLFVALDFLGDALYELDPNLSNPIHLVAENFGFLNAMDFGPDGYLYGPIWTQGKVVRIHVDSCDGSSSPYTECDTETVTDGLGVPAAVKFDSKGRLHVIDTLSGEVLRVNIETGGKKVIATLTPGLDNLAFDSKDRLFVSSNIDGFILQVCSDDDYGDDDPCEETRIVSRGGMVAPGGVAVLPDHHGESVFVGDLLSLREYNGRTGRQQNIEHHILTVPGIASVFTVAADGENLVLSSWFENIVQVWNPKSGEEMVEYTDFDVPLNAIRFQGDLVVAELGTGEVVRRKATGDVVLASGLIVPAGLAATEDDLWVGDWFSGIVWQIVADGKTLEDPIQVTVGLSNPEGLAVDLDGSLLVVESGAGRLSRINLSTREPTALVEGLELGAEGVPGYPPTWIFNGVAVGTSGAIYVTGDISNLLYRFRPLR